MSAEGLYPVIAFCGPATSGKTTAAKCLMRHGFRRMSFADPIRDMLRALGVSDHHLCFDKEAPVPVLCGKSARHAMQRLGTEFGRGMIGEGIWIEAARQRLTIRSEPVVFDDVRFDNEARMIREMGGLVVELSKPGVAYSNLHASENGISGELISHRIFAKDVAELEALALELVEAD